MEVTLTQHPVGQGGLSSGLLIIPGGRFHWIYDCGSNQTDALEREIGLIAARGTVDCLFLSHLDSDHVSGLDRLLAQTRVREVVLPYLNDIDRLVAAAHDAATGTLTGTFVTFLGDIGAWFTDRGVDRITYIVPRSDDEDGGVGPVLPRVGDGGGEGRVVSKWCHDEKDLSAQPNRRSLKGQGYALRLETSASMQLRSATGFLDWTFVPYAHRPSDDRLRAFRSSLFKRFGPKYLSRLSRLIGDKELLDKVRDCYDLIWSDHNLVSMALYAGPTGTAQWYDKYTQDAHLYDLDYAGAKVVGWLQTGDMHLNVGRRRRALIAHYQHLLDKVNVFALPHHGSHRNFHPSLPDSVGNAVHFFAAAGPNTYGHPDKDVIGIVRANGKRFVQISQKPDSALVWRHQT